MVSVDGQDRVHRSCGCHTHSGNGGSSIATCRGRGSRTTPAMAIGPYEHLKPGARAVVEQIIKVGTLPISKLTPGIHPPGSTRKHRPIAPPKESHMSEEASTQQALGPMRYLTARVSRAQLLQAAGAGAVLAAVPSIAGAQSTAPESVQDIINIADTAERLAVTLLTAAVGNASQLGLTGVLLASVQGALAEEQFHADFLEANGAMALTNTFTIPDPAILTDRHTFLTTLETAEVLFIGAYMAAVREFTALSQPVLAKTAFQIGAVESEHRAIVRAGLVLTGDTSRIPPNNKAFESNVVATVGDAAKMLMQLGFIGGTGTQVMYPGRAAALAAAAPVVANVTDQTPSSSVPLAAYPVPVHKKHHKKHHKHHHGGGH